MLRPILTALLLIGFTVVAEAQETSGVFVRFQLLEPANASWHVRLGGYIHVPNWHLPEGTVPVGADKDKTKWLKSGAFSEWFDLKSHAGKSLHERLSRAGGVAELPNVTAQFVTDEPAARRKMLTLRFGLVAARRLQGFVDEAGTGRRRPVTIA